MINQSSETKINTIRQNSINNKVRNKFRTLFRYFLCRWIMIWKGNPPGALLLFLGLLISGMMSIPIIYVVWRSLFAGSQRWSNLLNTRIPELLWNTLILTVGVTAIAVIIGVSLAWFVHRTDLPGKKIWQWVLALPLVIPPYVGSMTYVIVMGPRGWIHEWFGSNPFKIFSFWGTLFVLSMFTYPYVFLITGAALKRMNRNYEDAARSIGLGTSEIFWKVNLPFLRPSIGAGIILISLYVLSDFGAVSMLRYSTFTTAIYYRMGSYDNISATILSCILILLTIFIMWIETHSRKKQRFIQTSNSFKSPETLELGKWKWAVIIYVAVIFFLSVMVPLMVILYWSRIGIEMGALNNRFWSYAVNSIKVSGSAAMGAMILSLPIVYLKARYPSKITTAIEKLSYSGYALPGVIVALGIIFIFNQYIPWLYNKPAILTIAYLIRFLPQSMQSGEASLSLVSPRLDEAARNLGLPPWKVIIKVILPLISPGVLAGGALVFVSSIKELPATLLLRSPGFDTMAVRVWIEASEAVYHLAAPSALVIILISILPLKWMLTKY